MAFRGIPICGVYRIRNITSGASYVGGSRDLRRRFNEHRSELRRGVHPSEPLQSDWNLFGEDAFAFEAIEECSSGDLAAKEAAWTLRLASESTRGGYNDKVAWSHSERTRRLIGAAHAGKEVGETARRLISEHNKQTASHLWLQRAMAERGLSSPNQKLSPAILMELPALRAAGFSPKALALRFGVNKSTITRALAGTTHNSARLAA